MHELAKRLLLRLFRVPAEPKPPEGSPESIRMFRAGRNYYLWRIIQWGALQLGIGILLVIPLVIPSPRKPPPYWLKVVMRLTYAGAAGLYLVSLPITYFKQRLDYEMRWYIVTDRSLRVRSGIWSIQEYTMTFANVQDIRISADILQRILGLADVKVTSAGGGGGSEQLGTAHHAELAGVDCAPAIRDLIVERLRLYRDAGLGDPDDRRTAGAAPAERPASPPALEAAQRVLAEARALRIAVESPPGA